MSDIFVPGVPTHRFFEKINNQRPREEVQQPRRPASHLPDRSVLPVQVRAICITCGLWYQKPHKSGEPRNCKACRHVVASPTVRTIPQELMPWYIIPRPNSSIGLPRSFYCEFCGVTMVAYALTGCGCRDSRKRFVHVGRCRWCCFANNQEGYLRTTYAEMKAVHAALKVPQPEIPQPDNPTWRSYTSATFDYR
jgi:hypothetical protein